MEQTPTNQDPIEEARPPRQGQRRWGKITPDSSTGEKAAPRFIDISHRPPAPQPPHWRIPASAAAALAAAQASAEKARQAVEAIEDRWRSKDRDLAALKSSIYSKEKELNGFRQKLTELAPATLKNRFELAFFRRSNFYGSSAEMTEWLDVSSLVSNAPALRKMLQEKIEESERELTAMEKERVEIEKELATESIE
jgi:hypothetical protein